ncbi:SH3 domain-containing protein [Candidatus Fukatsuia endosymbiont of Tuberolachnus salignus]|uniref:SH3 domain-containing protein n=1 Tax=Candidatus Fukatsuia endosymbiont of Tuberolachnus salignus TaxID=3077957 RepID=UPI00313E54BD
MNAFGLIKNLVKIMKKIISIILFLALIGYIFQIQRLRIDEKDHNSKAVYNYNVVDPTKRIFPLDGYDQNIDSWIPPNAKNYHIPILMDKSQNLYFSYLKSRYFGITENDESPWNPTFITKELGIVGENKIKNDVEKSIEKFTNNNSHVYGENFRKRTNSWKQWLRENASIDIDKQFNSHNRAIMITESSVRILPTETPAFDDFKKAGEGYPFDMLQISSVKPGTPVYIFGESKDKAWKLIISPSVTGWVKNNDLAKTDEKFISQWRAYAEQALGAFTKEPVSVNDLQGHFRFIAKIGTLLPIKSDETKGNLVVIPIRNEEGYAKIAYSVVTEDAFSLMPIKTTPKNFAKLIKSMHGKPYGWGNLYLNNDCSAEIRNLMLPFGVFFPRSSTNQAKVGRQIDLSHYDSAGRLAYLVRNGKPFTTIIYIKGHVMLYTGNAKVNGKVTPMTYQNVWGIKPEKEESRSIIGGSVFLPLLSIYPEDPSLESFASKELFKLIYLD